MSRGEWEETEKAQREMRRRILGILEKTTHKTVMVNFGYYPLKMRRDMLKEAVNLDIVNYLILSIMNGIPS